MEQKLTKILKNHILNMKQNIKKKMVELDITPTPKINALFQFIYDYKQIQVTKQDIA